MRRPLYEDAERAPGRVIQCDLWFPAPKIGVGFGQEAMLPVLVTVAAFSRFIAEADLSPRGLMGQPVPGVIGLWSLFHRTRQRPPRSAGNQR